ncbi:MAG: hypothetical protein LBD48_07085, partial [Treponema sp.]|nr:hypothetical protein [Treponema sp.]
MFKMKWFFIAACLIVLSSCEYFHNNAKETANEPRYKAQIAWETKTDIRRLPNMTLGKDCVYVFEDAEPGYFADFILTKLDAQTGKRLWS